MPATNITRTLRNALAASRMSLWELSRRTDLKVSVIESALRDAGQVSVQALERVAAGLDLELTLREPERTRQVGGVLSVVDLAIQRLDPRALASVPSAPWVLSLDLEGALIGEVAGVVPRPGLHAFLTCCRPLAGRVVVTTAGEESRFREVARRLVAEAWAPAWFADVEHVRRNDPPVVPDAAQPFTLLVGGPPPGEAADNQSQWVPVPRYEPPFDPSDRELDRVLEEIARRILTPPA